MKKAILFSFVAVLLCGVTWTYLQAQGPGIGFLVQSGGVDQGFAYKVNFPSASVSNSIATIGASGNVTVANEASDTTNYLWFSNYATGALPPKTNTALAFDASIGKLSSTTFFGENMTGTGTITAPNMIASGATSLLLGTAGTSVGSVGFRNGTSGTITVQPITGALGTPTLVLGITYTDAKWCSYATATGLTCAENAPQAAHASLTSISGLTETNGGIPYGTADNTYAWLAAGTQNYLLQANGAGAPSWVTNVTLGTINAGANGFLVDSDGDVTMKSYMVTRTDSPDYVAVFEATSDGDSQARWMAPAKGTGFDASRYYRFPATAPTAGQCMVFAIPSDNSTQATWVTPQTQDATLTALAGLTITEGSLIYGTAADTFAVLAKGTANQILHMNAGATAPEWQTAKYGEMYQYENVTATTIDTNNIYKAVRHYSTGLVNGFTFDAGSTGPISAFADYNGTVPSQPGSVLVTDVGHGLATGDIVTILGTTSYNGTFSVTKVSDDTFYILDTWVADDATGNWYEPSYLKADAGTSGVYRISWNVTADSAAAGETYKFEPVQGITALDKCASERNFATGADYGQLTANCLVSVTAGDRFWLSLKQTSAGNDAITVRHSNVNISRIP